MDKKVSVVMPNRNYDKYIGKAIDSVLQQTYENWELIIADDGSTDTSVATVRGYMDRYPGRIKLFTHPNGEHRNLSQTYQLAFENVTGDYIAFLESDDIWRRDSLAIKVKVLEEHRDAILVYTDIELFGEKGAWTGDRKTVIDETRRLNSKNANTPFFTLELMKRNIIPTFSVVMTRRGVLDDVDFNIPKEYEAWFDWWLWWQLSIGGKFFYVPQRKTKWRVHAESNNCKNSNNIDDPEQYGRSFCDILKERLIDLLESEAQKELKSKFLKMVITREEAYGEVQEILKVKDKQIKGLKLISTLLPFFVIRKLYRTVVKYLRKDQSDKYGSTDRAKKV